VEVRSCFGPGCARLEVKSLCMIMHVAGFGSQESIRKEAKGHPIVAMHTQLSRRASKAGQG
jgi:hypothetical protein